MVLTAKIIEEELMVQNSIVCLILSNDYVVGLFFIVIKYARFDKA